MLKRFLRRHEVTRVTGLSCSTLYDEMAAGRFPKPFRITANRVGWLESEIADWQKARLAERDSKAA